MLNNKKLLYRFYDEKYNTCEIAKDLIKKILVPATPKSSCWWSKMKSAGGLYKTKQQEITAKQIANLNNTTNKEEYLPTAKTCVGIIELLKHSYLIKSPCECIVTINDDGGYYYDTSDSSILDVGSHGKYQFYQENNDQFKNKTCIKFQIGLRVKSVGFSYMLSDPVYHKHSFFVPSGVVTEKFGNSQEMNVIVFIDTPPIGETSTIHIKEGDVLAYLTPFAKCSLEFGKKDFTRSKFATAFTPKKSF